MTQRVFSYGTLRQSGVQRSLYGREVRTVADELPGFRLDWIEITDADVIAKSGESRHPILQRAEESELVAGAYLELTDEELLVTDDYEVDDYVRRQVMLRAGVEAWVYVADE